MRSFIHQAMFAAIGSLVIFAIILIVARPLINSGVEQGYVEMTVVSVIGLVWFVARIAIRDFNARKGPADDSNERS